MNNFSDEYRTAMAITEFERNKDGRYGLKSPLEKNKLPTYIPTPEDLMLQRCSPLTLMSHRYDHHPLTPSTSFSTIDEWMLTQRMTSVLQLNQPPTLTYNHLTSSLLPPITTPANPYLHLSGKPFTPLILTPPYSPVMLSPFSPPLFANPAPPQPPSPHPPTPHPLATYPLASQPPSPHPPTPHPLASQPPSTHPPTPHPLASHTPSLHPPFPHPPASHPPSTPHPRHSQVSSPPGVTESESYSIDVEEELDESIDVETFSDELPPTPGGLSDPNRTGGPDTRSRRASVRIGRRALPYELERINGKLVYSCDYCAQVFPQLFNLKTHRMRHTGEKPFECDVCKMKFVQKAHLGKHKASKHSCVGRRQESN